MTAIHYTSWKDPCLQTLVRQAIFILLFRPMNFLFKIAKDNGPLILDVRSDSAWQHISLNPKENAYGYIKGATYFDE
jgi:hypothetical protein